MADVRQIAAEMLQLFGGDERRWTKHLRARDACGAMTQPERPEAVCWCLVGAFNRVTSKRRMRRADREEFVRALEARVGTLASVASWNDAPARTFSDIQELLREMMEEG